AHLGARGISAYRVHRRYVAPPTEASAQLLRLAITEHGLERARVVDALDKWAPTEHHASHVHSTDDRLLSAATWPDLALVVDGRVPRGFFRMIAAECAASQESSGAAIVAQALERMTQELVDARGLGVALMTMTGAFGATLGTVRCYPHPDPRSRVNASLPATHFSTEFSTLVLSTLPLAPEDATSVRPDPVEVHEAFRRLPLRSLVAKMVQSVTTKELGAPPVAMAALRAGWAPAPVLDHDPGDSSRRRERLLEIAERSVAEFGLSIVVRESVGTTNALFESEPCLQVVVVRDDVAGAADESAAARRLEELLSGEQSLRPFTVHGEYCK
ncbi:MAG TPA: hypothetical protein PKD61_40095, partial [Polyangiaceae bacterium]|nr:hypothetical protein [Polyangiaceae bacterium]